MCLINVWQQQERICLIPELIWLFLQLSSSSRSNACWGVDLCFCVMYNGVSQRLLVDHYSLSPLACPPTVLSNAPLAALLSSLPPSVLSDFKNSLCYNVSSNLLHNPSLCDHTEQRGVSELKEHVCSVCTQEHLIFSNNS